MVASLVWITQLQDWVLLSSLRDQTHILFFDPEVDTNPLYVLLPPFTLRRLDLLILTILRINLFL